MLKVSNLEEIQNARLIAVTQPVVEEFDDAYELIAYCARVSNPSNQLNMDTADKLLNYLKKHRHWSPFEMANAVVEINVPRDIGRQLIRHASLRFQEFSQRYADVRDLEDAFCLRELRMQDDKNRQNSIEVDDDELKAEWDAAQREVLELATAKYGYFRARGVAKECCRVFLPEGLTMSRVYANGTIRSWIHYADVRIDEGVTQKEHVALARLIATAVNKCFPIIEVN